MSLLPFNRPLVVGTESELMADAIGSSALAGGGRYTRLCEEWFERHMGCERAMMTPSCTAALEMAAMLIGIQPGDEVIMPSYTFVSAANAFALRGAKIVFVDILADSMNIDPQCIESAITSRTRAIVPAHYAGNSCDMDAIGHLAQKHGLWVVEDAAQAQCSRYKGEPVGSRGHLSCFSFHETKNFTAGGEGGMLCVNDPAFVPQAEIIREKGTNRNQFFRGQVDKYTWVGLGSSYLASEIQAAYLFAGLQEADSVTQFRRGLWNRYHAELQAEQAKGIVLPVTQPGSVGNGHLFHLKLPDALTRQAMIAHLRANNIMAVFHYVPLHSSPMGVKLGTFVGTDRHTTSESARLLRLPMFYGLQKDAQDRVIESISQFKY